MRGGETRPLTILMNAYTRKPISLGKTVSSKPTVKSVGSRNDPLSADFNPGGGDKPKDIALYMIACLTQQQGPGAAKVLLSDYGGTFGLIRQVKRITKKWHCTALQLKRAIRLASYNSTYFFTMKYVETFMDEVMKL